MLDEWRERVAIAPVKFRQHGAARGHEYGAKSFRRNGIANILGRGPMGVGWAGH